jgi:hypothetical protein
VTHSHQAQQGLDPPAAAWRSRGFKVARERPPRVSPNALGGRRSAPNDPVRRLAGTSDVCLIIFANERCSESALRRRRPTGTPHHSKLRTCASSCVYPPPTQLVGGDYRARHRGFIFAGRADVHTNVHVVRPGVLRRSVAKSWTLHLVWGRRQARMAVFEMTPSQKCAILPADLGATTGCGGCRCGRRATRTRGHIELIRSIRG